MFKIIAAAWLTAWVVKAVCDVGNAYSAGIYTWALPIALAGLLLTTFILGYFVAKEDDDTH